MKKYRSYASLCVYHKAIKAEEVTKILRLTPTSTVEKGGVYKLNGWFLSTKNQKSQSDHISDISDIISSRKSEIRQLQKKNARIEVRFFCEMQDPDSGGGPTIDPGSMKLLGGLNILILMDIYSRR